MNRDGKGVEKVEEGPKNLKNFFKKLGRNFSKLLSVNLMMLGFVLPVLAAIYIFIQGPTVSTYVNPVFPVTQAIAATNGSPAADLLLLLTSNHTAWPMPGSYVNYVIAALAFVYLLTFGWQNVGSSYLLRGIVRGDPVFVISDYFYAIKKNLRQGFFVGLIDGLALYLLAFDFFFFYEQPDSYLMNVGYFMIVALIIVYGIMRFYIYQQLITFDLKTRKIIKNAFIFTALGIKRNLMAILGIVIMAALNLLLILMFMPLNVIIPIIIPFFYFLAISGFMTTYAAYPVIEKYMIEGVNTSNEDSSGDDGSMQDSDVDPDAPSANE